MAAAVPRSLSMSQTMKPRRAAGTRTMPDVLGNFFRPPTAAQKAEDLREVLAGRELLVTCRLNTPHGSGVKVGGYLRATCTCSLTGWSGKAATIPT